MQSLTPDQAQQLWRAGGFLVIRDLPEGSEFGIDGTFHVVRRFSGVKFLPPGAHMITWAPPVSLSAAGPSTLPIRSTLIRVLKPRERVVLSYDRSKEEMRIEDIIISDDSLRTLDKEMAPYPFEGLELWKQLTAHLSEDIVQGVLGTEGVTDGMRPVEGEQDESSEIKALWDIAPLRQRKREGSMRFVSFNIKRSWPPGAVGEELSRYAQDKSWLFGHVVKEQCGGDPGKLLAQFQLAFLLVIHVSSYSALMTYKRLLSLFCRSTDLQSDTSKYLKHPGSLEATYTSLLDTICAHLIALPETAFDTELPELDAFMMDALSTLRLNMAAPTVSETAAILESNQAWRRLDAVARDKWSWDIGGGSAIIEHDENGRVDFDEEDEYAPVIVDLE